MENIPQIKEQLQKALHVVRTAEKYEETALLIAQKLGLQGEKRRLRYESAKNHILANKIRTCAYDEYLITLSDDYQKVSLPELSSFKMFFETYLAKMEEEYDALHTIANALVVLNARHFAQKLYHKCDCLMDDIVYYNRSISEGNIANWRPEWVFLHQTTMANTHDEYEKKENGLG